MMSCYDVSALFRDGEEPEVLRVNGQEYVPIVRCKDCKYWCDPEYEMCILEGGMECALPNDFCSDGERKGDDE